MTTNGENGNGHLPIHELATIFPPMTDDEFEGLKDDIMAHGVHQPIAVWQGAVIDGRNRYLAAQELGIDPPFRYLDDETDPVDFVLSANMNRRNLDASQRAIVMAALPKLRRGENQHREDSNMLLSSADRAKRAAISSWFQRQADSVLAYGDKTIVDQIRAGRLTVTDAYKSIRASRDALRRVAEAEQARVEADAAAKAGREALEKAKAEREAAEREAAAQKAAAEKAEQEAAKKARGEREVVEKARLQRDAAAKAEREALEKARAEREAAEREAVAQKAAAEKAEREATEKAKAVRESELLAAAQQQMAEDPSTKNLVQAVKEQHRREALEEAAKAAEKARDSHHPQEQAPDTLQVGHRSRVVFTTNMDPGRGVPSLTDESVALTFTSPPYWNYLDYGYLGVGYEESYQQYIDSLRALFTAVFQKTMPGGRAVVNVSNMKSRQDVEGRAFLYPIVADTIGTLTQAGFTFFDEIIWHKRDTTTGPMSGSPLWGSYPYPPTPKILDSIFENILVFTKPGQREVDMGTKELSRLTVEDWREYTNGVWRIESGSDPNHPATFPMEMADRVIRMYSFVHDLVLDPFAGTGTAVISAEKNGRTSVGYEVSLTYKPTVQDKAVQWLAARPRNRVGDPLGVL